MSRARGFTLVEVLIALAITAFVSTIAYSSLSTVLLGAEANESAARRSYAINRAWMMLSRDLEHFVARPVRDEFGEPESALSGGPAARFQLSLSRAGWHNATGVTRGEIQRVNYRLEDGALWRDAYTVLDRADDSEPQRVKLLEGVLAMDLLFLASESALQASARGTQVDTRSWPDSWVADPSRPGTVVEPPLALQLQLELEDWGEMRRLYVLPPL